jgi:hypothetical protein
LSISSFLGQKCPDECDACGGRDYVNSVVLREAEFNAGLQGIGNFDLPCPRYLEVKNKRLTLDKDISGSLLIEIRGALEHFGCQHGTHDKSTPPMMFPEWIACAISSREALLRECRDAIYRMAKGLRYTTVKDLLAKLDVQIGEPADAD